MQYIIPLRRPVIRLVTLHTVNIWFRLIITITISLMNVIGELAALFFANHSIQL